jgi:rare lipoprotein A
MRPNERGTLCHGCALTIHAWFSCEVPMRSFSTIVAIAAVTVWVAMHLSPAVAQDFDFDDRWSVIPKAHAEPAPVTPDQTKQVPTTQNPSQNPSDDKSTDNSGDRSEAGSTDRVFSGMASFYSYKNAKTSTGSSFDRDALTAAHRTLPIGTKVRVTDVATNKSVVVSITDRGPVSPDRVLDLSLGAARSLGITDRGVVEVRAEVL